MDQQPPSQLERIQVLENEVFPDSKSTEPFLTLDTWDAPITYFVGRNGSAKSRTARIVASKLGGRSLSTDRLTGIMGFQSHGWGHLLKEFQGLPLDAPTRERIKYATQGTGTATEEYFALKEQPEVLLRVGAFLRRALNRHIELRETSGYLDPYIVFGDVEYSLLRDEGHGLRELVSLLASIYRKDWNLLVIDEPELHLHPSMLRLWLGELERECRKTGRRAVIVTHEPSAITPRSAADLNSLWLFQPGASPICLGQCIDEFQKSGVNASLARNTRLVSQLVFAPRPVLVEGLLDVAALSVVFSRSQPAEVVAQTELIDCGGSGGVALWFSIASKAKLDFKAIADLDACLESQVTSVMDATPEVMHRYQRDLAIEPPKTHAIIHPLLLAMNKAGVGPNSRDRAKWLAEGVPEETGYAVRKDKLLGIWRDAGLWLHPQGTLEDVLNTSHKSVEAVERAAATSDALNPVADWAAYVLDPTGEIEVLLRATVERIAQSIQSAQGLAPGRRFSSGSSGFNAIDSQLVDIAAMDDGRHRITVKAPEEFAGYWVEFDRQTSPSSMALQRPETSPNAEDAA